MGFDLIERLRFLASLCLAGTAQTEGGGNRVANNHFIPHLVTPISNALLQCEQEPICAGEMKLILLTLALAAIAVTHCNAKGEI